MLSCISQQCHVASCNSKHACTCRFANSVSVIYAFGVALRSPSVFGLRSSVTSVSSLSVSVTYTLYLRSLGCTAVFTDKPDLIQCMHACKPKSYPVLLLNASWPNIDTSLLAACSYIQPQRLPDTVKQQEYKSTVDTTTICVKTTQKRAVLAVVEIHNKLSNVSTSIRVNSLHALGLRY